MKQAAEIMLGQVRSTKFNTDKYPLYREISNIKLGKEWIPSYLLCSTESVVKKKP